MKAVILAGGYGTRIAEETDVRPKPMVEIGGMPIIWHILKMYSAHGINDFIICLGYKGYIIKEYFYNYYLHSSDVTIDMSTNKQIYLHTKAEPWKVTLIDTGLQTQTGGRLKRIRPYLADRPFCLTYGDGVADVDIAKLITFHESHGRLATVTAVRNPGRFGALRIAENTVEAFEEKPLGDGAWVNGGFFVLSPKVIDYIEGDNTVWEREPLETLAKNGQLAAFRHQGFWQPMDTLRDKRALEQMWAEGRAPWKIW